MLARYKTMLSGVVNVGPLQDKACQEWSMLARYKTRLVRSGQWAKQMELIYVTSKERVVSLHLSHTTRGQLGIFICLDIPLR
jgi:hypothetical protein